MKIKTTIIAAIIAAGCTQFAQTSFANDKETAPSDETHIPGIAAQPDSYFFTGKPYDAELGGYVFAARVLDPNMNRWTTPDPSGFPDGPNNRIYAPVPTNALDPSGSVTVTISGTPKLGFKEGNYSVSTNMTPVEDDNNDEALGLLGAQFPSWNTVNGGEALGTINVTTFAAGFHIPTGQTSMYGGLNIIANYNGVAPVTGYQWMWIQVITRNDKPGYLNTPYLDDHTNPTSPFYPYAYPNPYPNYSKTSSLGFYDYPASPLTDINSERTEVFFSGDLFLASVNPIIKSITLYDGLTYGWTLKE